VVFGDEGVLVEEDAVFIIQAAVIIALGLVVLLAVRLGVDELAQEEIAHEVAGAIAGEQGREGRVGGVAKVILGGQDFELVILHLAVARGAGEGEGLVGAEAEAGEGDAQGRVGRDGEIDVVGAGRQGKAAEDLLAGIRPAAVFVEIDPAVEKTVPGGGDSEGGRAALGEMAGIGKEHAVFVIPVEVVAGGVRIRLAVLLGIDQAAQIAVAGDDVAGAVLLHQGRVFRIRRIAEIPVDADRLDLHAVVDAAVGPDLKADLEALAGRLGRDLEVGKFVAVAIAELGGEIALAFHKTVTVGIGILLLRAGGALAVVVEPLDEVIGEAGLK